MTHAEMFADSPIKIGAQYKFVYPVEFETLPEYSARRDAVVTVLRPCAEDEADVLWDDWRGQGEEIVDRMFRVRAPDGWEGYAWESELEDI